MLRWYSEPRRGARLTGGGSASAGGSRQYMTVLAGEADADPGRNGPGLVAEPGGNNGAKAAGRAPGGDDEQILGRRERDMLIVSVLDRHQRSFSHPRPVSLFHASPLEEELLDVLLAPTGIPQTIPQLFRHDDRVVAAPDRIMEHVGPHLRRERLENLLAPRPPPVPHLPPAHLIHI